MEKSGITIAHVVERNQVSKMSISRLVQPPGELTEGQSVLTLRHELPTALSSVNPRAGGRCTDVYSICAAAAQLVPYRPF